MGQQKIYYISALNCFAAFSVVILNCNQAYWNYATGPGWTLTNLIETLFYWAVPIFFMNIGMTSLNYRERYSTAHFLWKRVIRIGIPFVCWSLIGLVMRWLQLKAQMIDPGVVPKTVERVDRVSFGLWNIIQGIIHTDYVNVYWFFIPLFIVYLCIPCLSLIPKKVRIPIFTLVIVYELIIYAIVPLLQELAVETGWTLPGMIQDLLQLCQGDTTRFGIPHSHGMLTFVLLGYCIGNIDFRKWQRMIIYGFAIGGWMMHFFGTSYLSKQLGIVCQVFKGYENLPSVLMTMGVFLFAKHFFTQEQGYIWARQQSWMYELSTYTFGIYLVHVYFNEGLPVILHLNVAGLPWLITGPVMVFGFSFVVVWIMKKIPLIRYLVP